jgi:hypothetical protein
MIELSTIQVIFTIASIVVSIVSSIVWASVKVTKTMNDMDKTLIEIKTLLQATITRIEHIEKSVEKLDHRVSQIEKTIDW